MNLISFSRYLAGFKLSVLTVCIFCGTGAFAEGVTLYRCVIDGTVAFRQTACPAGENRKIHVTDHSRGISPSEPAIRYRQKKSTPKSHTSVSLREDKHKPCWKKRRQLEWVERRLRAGYKASEYERLHQRQARYENYIREFCR